MKKFTLLFTALACCFGSIFADTSLEPGAQIEENGLKYRLLMDGTFQVQELLSYSLSTVTIPSHVTVNGEEYTVSGILPDAFKNKPLLSKVVIPETVKTIGTNTFQNCYTLRGMTIPATVEGIGLNSLQRGPIFVTTPIDVISFMGTNVPKGDLNLIFESPYLKKIIVPTAGAENFEKAYPILKKDRIRIDLSIDPDVVLYSYIGIAPDFLYVHNALYPQSVYNSIVDIPLEASIYIKPGESIPFVTNYMVTGKWIYKIDGVKYTPTKRGTFWNQDAIAGQGFGIIEGLTQNCKIEIEISPEYNYSPDSVENVLEDFPATFAVYSADGVLVKSVATKADLQSMPKNVYILKAVDQTVKVLAGK